MFFVNLKYKISLGNKTQDLVKTLLCSDSLCQPHAPGNDLEVKKTTWKHGVSVSFLSGYLESIISVSLMKPIGKV